MAQNELSLAYEVSGNLGDIMYDNYYNPILENENWIKFDAMELKTILEKHEDYFDEEQRNLIQKLAKPFDNATVGDIVDALSDLINYYEYRD